MVLQTGAAYLSIERITSLYRVVLLGMDNVESRARRGKSWRNLTSLLINLSRTLHKLHSAWLLLFHYTTTIGEAVVFFVSDHHVPPKQMASEFIIKSTALEESVGDETWQD